MYRLRTIIPLFLTSLAPTFGDAGTTSCTSSSWSTPACEEERAREFAADRNAEINASIAAVAAARAVPALTLTYCKAPNSTSPRCETERAHELALELSHCHSDASTTPRCEAERTREFAAARNAEINASIAKVAQVRELALSLTHCKTAESTAPRCQVERAREFAAARNAEINASIAMVNAVRVGEFAAARNAEINASIAAVNAARERDFAAARNAEINASVAMVNFVRDRNSEINASIAMVKAVREREFAAARNAEVEASIAAVEFARARNAEINASIATVKAVREREFAAARNAEIDVSIAAVAAERALRFANDARNSAMDTGAISPPEMLPHRPLPTLQHTRSTDPCRGASNPVSPLQFSGDSATIDDQMKPQLDHLAEIAKSCPAVQIEIHGHSASLNAAQTSRSLAEHRAQSAFGYLVAAGVDSKRLGTIGHGDREPAESAANDRVEFRLQDPTGNVAALRIMIDLAELLDQSTGPAVAGLSP